MLGMPPPQIPPPGTPMPGMMLGMPMPGGAMPGIGMPMPGLAMPPPGMPGMGVPPGPVGLVDTTPPPMQLGPPPLPKVDRSQFTLPTDKGEAQELANEAIALWRPRDLRQDEDQYLWELHVARRVKRQQITSTNDNAVQLEKLATILSKAEVIPNQAANTDEDRLAAQKIEDFNTYLLDQWAQRQTRRLRGDLFHEVGTMAGLRGWLAAEVMQDSESLGFPFGFRLLDPRLIYPDTDDGEPNFYVHKYTALQRSVEAMFGKKAVRAALKTSNQQYNPVEGNRLLTLLSFYTKQETAILLEQGDWVKPPTAHGYGFCPLITVVGPGAPFRATDTTVNRDTFIGDHVRYIGAGFLRTIKAAVKDKQELASMLRTTAAKTAAPPMVVQQPPNGEVTKDDIPTDVNEIAVVPAGTAVQQLAPQPSSLQHMSAALSEKQDEINRAGFGGSAFGQSNGASGFQQQESYGTDIDVIGPWAKMIQGFWQECLRAALRIFALYGPPSIFFTALDRSTGMRTAANRLSPADVLGADTKLSVELGDLGLHDKQAMGMLAATLIDRGVIDHETALSDYLHHRNPAAIRKAAIRDQGYKDPMIMRLRTLLELAKDVEDPLQPVWGQLFQHTIQQFMQQMLAPPPPPGPPGGAGAGPPLPNSGMPSAALPPAMGLNAGAGPNGGAPGPPQMGAGMPAL